MFSSLRRYSRMFFFFILFIIPHNASAQTKHHSNWSKSAPNARVSSFHQLIVFLWCRAADDQVKVHTASSALISFGLADIPGVLIEPRDVCAIQWAAVRQHGGVSLGPLLACHTCFLSHLRCLSVPAGIQFIISDGMWSSMHLALKATPTALTGTNLMSLVTHTHTVSVSRMKTMIKTKGACLTLALTFWPWALTRTKCRCVFLIQFKYVGSGCERARWD